MDAVVVVNDDTLFSTAAGSVVPATSNAFSSAQNTISVHQAGRPGSIVTVTVSAEPVADPSLVLWYPLDGNMNDASGSSLHATPTNAFWVSDRHGNPGAAFHAPTNMSSGSLAVPVGSPIAFPTNSAFSMSAWINADALPAGPESGLIVSQGLNEFSYAFSIRPGGTLIAQICTPSDFCHTTEATPGEAPNTPLEIGQWTHIGLVYDGTAGGQLKFYKNGLLVGQNTVALAFGTADTMLWFGAFPLNPTYWFAGAIDEIRIYNRALSGAELLALAGS